MTDDYLPALFRGVLVIVEDTGKRIAKNGASFVKCNTVLLEVRRRFRLIPSNSIPFPVSQAAAVSRSTGLYKVSRSTASSPASSMSATISCLDILTSPPDSTE